MNNNLSPKQSENINATNKYKKGSFVARLGAFIIDQIIILIALVILSVLLEQINIEIPALSFIVAALFSSLFIWKVGATPGKMVFKLKVVTSSYKPVSFWSALLRESIGKWISGFLASLGYFWVLIDRRKQAWHDKIAHTFVIKLDNTGKLIPVASEEAVTTKGKVVFALIYLIFGLPFIAAAIFIIVYVFFFRPFQISGNAMLPNYLNGQYYFTNIIALRLNKPTIGDVIIFKAPPDPEKDYVKRVVGVPGDAVSIKDGNVYLNGRFLDESAYIKPSVKTYGGDFLHDNESVDVPADYYFVMGDNRTGSSDSRSWGFVPAKNIISKVMFCYFKCTQLVK